MIFVAFITMTKKALSLTEFTTLPRERQLKLLQEHGVYVGKRRVDELTAVLFQLHAFYVELFYKVYRKVVDHIDISDDPDILQPYLNQVNVRDLKNPGE